MKKQSMYIRLQKQYKKLNSRIQKSIKNGKFYQFTQFKQEQLLARLKRCSLQIKNAQWNLGMKQVAASLAVVGTLGVATPAVGQYVPPAFVEKTGVDNPFFSLNSDIREFKPSFVDIDNDGDLDMFITRRNVSTTYFDIYYYENTGTASLAVFSLQTGTANPLDVANSSSYNILTPSFVDIDNDGDMDCFAGIDNAYNYGSSVNVYYENTGTATSPTFVERIGLNNPLDSVQNALGGGTNHVVSHSFVDIDNDGDQDCFVGAIKSVYSPSTPYLWYYKNTGTATVPTFERQIASSNSLDSVDVTYTVAGYPFQSLTEITFQDMDADGDQDAFINAQFTNGNKFQYYENTGTISTPLFSAMSSLISPLDSISGMSSKKAIKLVDIDGDTDYDVLELPLGNTGNVRFFENLDTTSTVSVFSIENEEISFEIYPNPTRGVLNFEEAITGTLSLYNITGQLLLEEDIINKQELDVTALENGLYFLYIETDKIRIRKKILVQK